MRRESEFIKPPYIILPNNEKNKDRITKITIILVKKGISYLLKIIILKRIAFFNTISSIAVKLLKKQRIEKIMNIKSLDYSRVFPFSLDYIGKIRANNIIKLIMINLKIYKFFLTLSILCPLNVKVRNGSIVEQQAKNIIKKYHVLFNP